MNFVTLDFDWREPEPGLYQPVAMDGFGDIVLAGQTRPWTALMDDWRYSDCARDWLTTDIRSEGLTKARLRARLAKAT
tara:strand:+ start:663 stop:896 length:234 start_codon:yes stop_codon:yes gene_type:complete